MQIISSYIETIAKCFWHKTKLQKNSPPYDISGAVSLILPLDIVSMSELTLRKIDQWLRKKGITISTDVNDRYLHGFVLVRRGMGFMFVDGTDSQEERTFTIAHEASHFILDYQIPRDKAIEKFGSGIEDVLDGFREPTVDEYVKGLINQTTIRPFTHLLEKDGDGSFQNIKVYDAENNADALAIELLAPHSEIVTATLSGRKKIPFELFDQQCFDILISKYKLPSSIAKQYSKRLAYSVTGGPSIMSKLGF